MSQKNTLFPIDIVYLWVDGSDKNWAKEKAYWVKKIKGISTVTKYAYSDVHYRDHDELKYSLRSVVENAPWVNHIYIITSFNQIPKWLDMNNPKITIISDTDIMPDDALPTFNSSSIEMCMANITNLSEHFLLMNDDMMFNKKVKPSFFYDKNGRAIVLYNKHHDYQKNIGKWLNSVDEYTQTIILCAKKIHEVFNKKFYKYRLSHGIDPYIKSSILECKNHPLIHKDIESNIRNKFRANWELQRWLFSLYDLAMNRAVFKHCHPYKSRHKMDFIYNLLHCRSVNKSPVYTSDVLLERKSIEHAPIFCINDNEKLSEEILLQNYEFLQTRFPNKSEFEK